MTAAPLEVVQDPVRRAAVLPHQRFRLFQLRLARKLVEEASRDLPVFAGRGEIAGGARQFRKFEARFRLQGAVAGPGREQDA